jgi:DNA excision repair protein ERCC-4
MQRKPIPVIVDDREQRGEVLKAIIARDAFDIRVARLDTGDYLVDDRFLFERKTLPDFASSVISGRIFEQALRLAEQDAFHPALILEGTSSDLRTSRIRREALHGALITVSIFIGLPVLRTRNAEETVNAFLYASRQSQTLAHGGLPRRGYRPKGKAARQYFILQGLPGIGPERARRLLERFESVQAVMAAAETDLAEIDGIGPRTARRIRWSVEETLGNYS